MITLRHPSRVRAAVRAWRVGGDRVGFVPTMGSLHEGHRVLLRRARRDSERVVASIFVNPFQFGPNEDYARYPRPVRRDRAILREEGVDLLYHPAGSTLYPEGHQTRVRVDLLREPLEGRLRPGHFDGVATVVAKLLAAVEPDSLYLGQKDAQQAILLRRMVRDLDMGARVVVCPTVREPDGLACSSRNAYLTPEERRWAPILYRTLREAARAIRSGAVAGVRETEPLMRRRLGGGPGRIDYARAVDAETLEEPATGRAILLAVAYRLPRLRLIDNVVVRARGAR